MNSQFNYDLDEKKMKILLQDAEVEFNEEAWQKFEKLKPLESKSTFENIVPKINIGISRSIIVPIIFILLIGCFSSILFSFVDFKKKPEVIIEIPMIVKPTIKPEIKSSILIKKNIPLVKDTISAITSSVIVVATKIENENKLKIQEDIKLIENISQLNKIENQRLEVNKPNEIIDNPKKKQKLNPLKLPIIRASTNNLNGYNGEPELELK